MRSVARAQIDRIVVGFDGSSGSIVALRWALAEAERRNVELAVVHVAPIPAAHLRPDAPGSPLSALRRRVEAELRGLAGGSAPSVPVSVHLANGSAAVSLARAAHGASMLVVGAHGWLPGEPLLGSVGRIAAEVADCPVVVIPERIDRLHLARARPADEGPSGDGPDHPSRGSSRGGS